jgi:oxygen-independent coproporphyrinogen-3 oxidase
MENHSIYVHIPFCRRRCGYCDFNTFAGLDHLIEPYIRTVLKEIEWYGSRAEIPVHTVYFGGGTPSLLAPELVDNLMSAIRENFDLLPESEVTMEANPGTVDAGNLRGYLGAGINRLSLGVQSAVPEELRLLDRLHGYPEAVEAVKLARQAGFENLSFDLIYGLPDQQVADWEVSLEAVLELEPEHLSLYALTVEEGTPLASRVAQGIVTEPDPDAAADIYEWTIERLESLGWVQYEISNWVSQDMPGIGLLSRHNLQYWLNQPYFGIGAGAHGFVFGSRYENVSFPASYIRAFSGGGDEGQPFSKAVVSREEIDHFTEMQETMMMGLRLVQAGVSRSRFHERFGEDFSDVFAEEIKELLEKDLVEWVGEGGQSLRLTRRARLLGNQVFRYFV